MRARLMLTIVVVAVAVITAACGDSKSSLLPTAPSALPTATSNIDAGTTAVGTMGNGPKPGNGNGGGNSPAPTTETTIKVDFEGLIDDVASGSITVSGQVVYVTGSTVIRHGDRTIPPSELCRNDRVHVSADRVGTTVTATEIKLQNTGNPRNCFVPPPPDPDQVVSVTASDAEAMEGADTGTFRFSRTGTQTQLGVPLSVTFALNGTASAGDYTLAPLPVSFGANQATVDLTVTPVNDGLAESSESLVLTVSAGTGYQVGSPASATVTIHDAPDPDQVVTVTASDAIAYETTPTGVDTGSFQLTRSSTARQLLNSLTVSFTLGGPASNGGDYTTVPLTATFAANSATANVTVTPVDDGVTESPELVVLTLTGGAGYQVGSPSAAQLTIADSPLPQVSITSIDDMADENGFNNAFFVLSRNGSLSAPLTVTVRFSGTASAPGTAGADYMLQGADNNNVNPITVTFPANSPDVMIRVILNNDGLGDPDETIEFTVVDGDAYDLGPIFSGLIRIIGG